MTAYNVSVYKWIRSWLKRRRAASARGVTYAALLVAVLGATIAGVLAYPFYVADAELTQVSAPGTAIDATSALAALTTNNTLDPTKVEQAYAPHRAGLRQVRVLMVPSFLSDFLMPARNAGLTNYFSQAEVWLAGEGIAMDMARSNTAASSRKNARWIAGYVDAANEPVCLITHSKGGIDVLTFLLEATPKQRAKIACWIALQPPFGGSPVADQILANADASTLSDGSLQVLGGSLEAVEDLSVRKRQQVLATNDATLNALAADIPMLAIAGRFTPTGWLDDGFPYTIPGAWLEDRGFDNDGLVPVASAKLPHTPFIIIESADHGATVRDKAPLSQDAGLFIQALFAVMMDAHAKRDAVAYR